MKHILLPLCCAVIGLLVLFPQAVESDPAEQVFLADSRGHLSPLPYKPGMTVVQALLQLGGITETSPKLYLIRDGKRERVDMRAVLNGDASKDRLLQPGDILSFGSHRIAASF